MWLSWRYTRNEKVTVSKNRNTEFQAMRNTRGIFNLVLAVLAQPLCAHADEAVTLSDA